MAYIPPLNGGRINATISGNTAGAGALISTGSMVLAGGNNITLSQNGQSITISGANAPSGSINFSASNTSANLASVTFSNSNGVSFGLTNGTITASHNGLTSQSNQAISASNGSFTFQTLTFANSNGISFSTGTQGLYASHNAITSQSNQTLGINVTSNTIQSNTGTVDARFVTFNGMGGASVGYSNGSIQVSAPSVSSVNAAGIVNITSNAGNVTISAPAFSAGISSNSTVTNQLILAAGNNVTLSQATNATGATLSIGVSNQSNQNLSLTATGVNTVQNSTGTMNATNMFLSGAGNVSVGFSNGTMQISGSQSVQTQSNIQGIIASGSTNRTGDISFANSNGVTFGLSNNTVTASVAAAGGAPNFSAGTTSNNLGSVVFSNSNGVGFGLSGSTITAANTITFSAGSQSTLTASGTMNATAFNLNGVGAISAGFSNSSAFVSSPIMSLGMSTSTAGGATGGTSGTVSNGLYLAAGSNITLSQSTGASGATVSIYGTSGGAGGGGIALSVGGTNYTSGTVNLSAAGALTLSTANTNQTLTMSVPAQSTLTATGALSLSTNGNTISIGAPLQSSIYGSGGISVSSTSNSIYVVGNPVTFNSTILGAGNELATNTSSLAQNTLYIFPEAIQQYVSGSIIKIPVFLTNSTSVFAAHTRGHTVRFGVYTRHATNSTVLTQMYSTSYTAAVSANSNATMAYSLITGLGNSTSYNSLTGSSAGSGISSVINGGRELLIGFATKLSPGEYWFAIHNSSSSGGAAGNLFNLSYAVNQQTKFAGNAFGIPSASNSLGIQQNLGYGIYSAATTALPALISMSEIVQGATNPIMYFFNATA